MFKSIISTSSFDDGDTERILKPLVDGMLLENSY